MRDWLGTWPRVLVRGCCARILIPRDYDWSTRSLLDPMLILTTICFMWGLGGQHELPDSISDSPIVRISIVPKLAKIGVFDIVQGQ